MIEKIKQLLDSKSPDDILLALEFMFTYLTIKEIRDIKLSRPVPNRGHSPVFFKIDNGEYIVYNNAWLWITRQPMESYRYTAYLGEHPELKK